MTILELAHPSLSYTSISQCKPNVVCYGGRLHVIVFGILSSDRALNCTNILYFEDVSKYFCMERSLVWSSRMEFLPYHCHLPSDLL